MRQSKYVPVFKDALISLIALCLALVPLFSQGSRSNLVILDKTSIANLGIQTVEVAYRDFADTLFVIGRIEPIPSRKSVLSSRIHGRIVQIHAFEGDIVSARVPIVEIESLQPGNPPPTISLESQLPGMVMKSHTHVGKPVAPDSELFEIIDLTRVYAVARIPEDQAGKLALGTKAEIRVAALPDQHFEGELARFGTEANPVTGTIDAYFILDNPDYQVRPNMRTEFSVILNTRSNTMSIPQSAIQSDGINRIVFVKDFELPNAFLKAPVQIGAQNESYAEVLGGLFPGDEIVTKGAYSLLFAGGGGISLKDALDAAHGHEHNEDGSEITDSNSASSHGHDDGDGHENQGQLVLFLSILCALLLILLTLSIVFRQGSKANVSK